MDGDEVDEKDAEIRRLRHELDEAKSSMAVAECVKESMIELERQKATLDEELATMRQLLHEAHEDASRTRTSYDHQLAKARAILGQLENENQELKIHLKLGHKSASGAASVSANDSFVDKETIAVISDATKSLARRMKSNLLQTSSPSSASASSASTSASSPHLDDSMKKAYEDTELLKSIVVPLEEQIGALKEKLRDTDALLRQHEDRQGDVVKNTEALVKWMDGMDMNQVMAELLSRSQEAEMAEAKEAAKGDLYIALMSTRYSLLCSELTGLRKEHAEVVDLLGKERLTTKRLKQEAVIATSEMVKTQREHLAEITRLQSVLTEEQKGDLLNKPTEESKSPSSFSVGSSPESTPSRHDSQQSDGSSSCGGSGSLARIVSNVEWEDMQKELAKVRALLGVGAGDSVVGSDQYRALQSELIDLKKQRAQIGKTVEKLKEEAKEDAVFRRRLEEKWNEHSEAQRTEIEALNGHLKECENLLDQVRINYGTTYEATRKDLHMLTSDREKIVRELKRLQDENDNLVGKHSAHSEEMQNEFINLPERTEDMHLLLLKLREDLIAAKVAKERFEERLKSEVGLLKSQLVSVEQAKKTLEDEFSVESDSLRSTIESLRSAAKDLEHEQSKRKEALEREEKSRQLNESLEKEKLDSDTKLHDYKSRIAILQQELDNSVAVQNDFVRLSQSLQMELEKIRQSEKEVRWQHEDDVDACQNCKQVFGGARKRNKHHCRHCGRIFCSDCVTKAVESGPRRRPAKVCDVCHTLLNQNSAPYFSSEAPQANH